MTATAHQISLTNDLRHYITDVPDFPRQGILFRDISPLLRQRFEETIKAMTELFTKKEWDKIDLIGGIESRGFILAQASLLLNAKGL